ncbi:nucloid associated Lsr2-like [Gordonia phage Ronaldo]|uniref:Lsr2-like DNA bridging protein n=4 Tax=Ronaldovirus TaxID=2733205 RepID=A0A6B9L8H5_9CAUD|nr:nucloid associated Lsr2-like [Gordonia phage Fryberger]YP_009807726.1 nucloid associated Lsr2-like [Gordonia phage Ronaldo]QDH48369.1 Lsr2-like DNA bridging protein [Gordonia phage Ziko]QHB38146.1 Lsr2-like DNA bridging protein [Gordonia phage Volt]QTF81816.1 Lsr2-like DNA bridging protein [Gordonia phage Guey18]AXN53445.1 Lsr2-like DNA bridging protein [Gordonia phage Fryberger]AXN53592.1 Lsr2-like DNA bridging protein [Gordonia phage Ronaldo]
MAKKLITQTQYVDDFTNAVVPEEELKQVTVAFGGRKRALDLSEESYRLLKETMEPWLKAGSSTSRTKKQFNPRATTAENTQARKWARENGIPVSSRGVVSNAVLEQWRKATQK